MPNFTLLQRVVCPQDRGDEAYEGRIMEVADNESEHMGKKFRWITVERIGKDGRPAGTKHIWPSTRLEAI